MLHLDIEYCLPLLLNVALKSVFVSAAALAALPLLRRASAATRQLVLLAGLGVLLGLPALMPLLPRQSLPHQAAVPRVVADAAPLSALAAPVVPTVSGPPAQPLDAVPLAAQPPLPSPSLSPAKPSILPSLLSIQPTWLVLGWLVGALVCLGRTLAVHARVWCLVRRCLPLPSALLSAVSTDAGAFAVLKTGPVGTPPMVWGWPRSVLLLPPDAADWPAAQLQSVLRHEAAHVRHSDWLTQTLAQAACAVYWFNPFVWLLAARLSAEAERACDDAVLLSGIPPTEYADNLLAVARSLGSSRTEHRASAGAVTMARRSPVRGRLEAILDARRPRRQTTRRAAAFALTGALAVAAPLAALRPAVRADAPTIGQPPAGVPTEADIARVQKHLHHLEETRANYAAAHPNTLSPARIALVDRLIQQRERQRGYERFGPQGEADYKRLQAEAKKPHAREERKRIWWALFAYEHRPANVVKSEHEFNMLLARLQSSVDALPAAQVARETKMYGFDEAVALDKTQMERMQMERDLGYPLHMYSADLADTAHEGLESEKSGEMTRADRVHLFLLNAKAMQGKPLSDADLDSALVILHTPSTHPSEAHEYVIALLLDMRTTIASQQQKIRDAVAPLLTSSDRLERTYSKAVFRRYGAVAPPKAFVMPSARAPRHHRSTQQANQKGVPAMTPRPSTKATLRKIAAVATLAAGLTLPAHAQPAKQPKPTPSAHAAPTAGSLTASKTVTPAAPADAPHWTKLVLLHKPVRALIASMQWDRGGALPEGIDHVFSLTRDNAILLHATPAGRARVQEIVSAIDAAP